MSDYSISDGDDLAQLTAHERNCDWVKDGVYIERARSGYSAHVPFEEYLKRDNVLFICAKDIKPEERTGSVPTQGYVWT